MFLSVVNLIKEKLQNIRSSTKKIKNLKPKNQTNLLYYKKKKIELTTTFKKLKFQS